MVEISGGTGIGFPSNAFGRISRCCVPAAPLIASRKWCWNRSVGELWRAISLAEKAGDILSFEMLMMNKNGGHAQMPCTDRG